ncbi:MAG: ATP-binding protein [Anaerovoracaceae bacterium]
MKRVTLITGHYGSGKTEFSMNLTVDLKKKHDKVAILDLDIANPYFRSRERQKMLEDLGISIQFNSFGYDITEDLPALSATIKTPLENKEYMAVVDVGGDDSGARVLNQFGKYFTKDDSEMLAVINANRPETDNVEGAIMHIRSIEIETGIKMDGIINNTHMLKETTPQDIIKGYRLCQEVSKELDLPIVWNTCRETLLDELNEELQKEGIQDMIIYPIKLYMRPSWLEL